MGTKGHIPSFKKGLQGQFEFFMTIYVVIAPFELVNLPIYVGR